MKKATQLPYLTTSNFTDWYDALQEQARSLKVAYILNANLTPTTDPAIATQRQQHADQLRILIIPSLQPSIVERLPPTILRETPHEICNLIRMHIHESHIEEHEILDEEARCITFLPGTDFNTYVDKHLDIRQKMITVNYPNIIQERTTVKYMLQGLIPHPDLRIIAVVLVGNPPGTIRKFTNHVRQVMVMQHNQRQRTPSPQYEANLIYDDPATNQGDTGNPENKTIDDLRLRIEQLEHTLNIRPRRPTQAGAPTPQTRMVPTHPQRHWLATRARGTVMAHKKKHVDARVAGRMAPTAKTHVQRDGPQKPRQIA